MGGNWYNNKDNNYNDNNNNNNRGDDIDIASYAGGSIIDYASLAMEKKNTFITETSWKYPVLIAYSKVNNAQPHQFHRNAAHIRLAKWNNDMTNGDNKIDLYNSVMALVPPSLSQSPTASPLNTPNCNNNDNKYTNTEVILIGVLPVCLLFLLVVVIY
jgi:hypothetical protein